MTINFPVRTEEDMLRDEPQCYIRYESITQPDGSIFCLVETNDNDDDGVPGEIETWTTKFRDRALFDKVAGRSRTGITGIKVTVNLDGKELT